MSKHQHDHSAVLTEVRTRMPADDLLCDLGDLFRIFGDTTRIRILYALLLEDRNVGAIAELLKMEQSAISGTPVSGPILTVNAISPLPRMMSASLSRVSIRLRKFLALSTSLYSG